MFSIINYVMENYSTILPGIYKENERAIKSLKGQIIQMRKPGSN